jgi:hypothetical protein
MRLSLFIRCFMRLENTLGGIFDHSSRQNLSRSLISFVCAYGLPSSIQTTCFQWGSSPETEMAIATCWYCGQLTISLCILMCAWGYCLAGSLLAGANRFWAKMSCNLVKLTRLLIYLTFFLYKIKQFILRQYTFLYNHPQLSIDNSFPYCLTEQLRNQFEI